MERHPLLIDGQQTKAILCMFKTKVQDPRVLRVHLDELTQLVESLGIEVVGEVTQTRYRPFAKYYIGSGKVDTLRRKVRRLKANVVIFYNTLNSSQKLNLMRAVKCEVIDRYELTLEIFDQMASDALSKLQIQAARLDKQAPFYKLQASVNYQYDRPFFRAGGEYGFHAKMREMTHTQSKLTEKIDKLMEDKEQRIWRRKKLGFPVICIAGFYNAGKTSLFNQMTGDEKQISDRPFTTLSSKYQKRYIDWETTVLFIDTIGFMLDLNPKLIESFKLNLLDIRSSDLVLLLLDVTDPILNLHLKLDEGLRLLNDLGVSRDRIIIVFNKIDLDREKATSLKKNLYLDDYNLPWITVSAQDKSNLTELLNLIAERIKHIEEHPPQPVKLTIAQRAEKIVNTLLSEFPSNPDQKKIDPFQALVNAILTQNPAYQKLDQTIGITPHNINTAPKQKIDEILTPDQKKHTNTLKTLSQTITEKYDTDLTPIFNLPFNEARDRLMELPGITPRIADTALMNAAHSKVIPINKHITRITKRLQIVPPNATYEQIRTKLQNTATPDRFIQLHHALTKLGKKTCTPKNPNHKNCPLNQTCPTSTTNKKTTQVQKNKTSTK